MRLPESHARGAQRYPLLYLTDADWNFELIASYLDYLGDRYPEMIVAGIFNTDRNRDHVGVADPEHPGTGGADRFLQAMQAEILPRLAREFRSSGERVYFGHSFGGVFGIHALLKAPELFDAYILIGTSTRVADRYLFDLAAEALDADGELDKFLYLAVAEADGGATVPDGVAFAELLAERAPASLEWHFEIIPRTTHFTVVPPALHQAMDRLFPVWKLDEEMEAVAREQGADGLEDWFERKRDTLGFRFHPERLPSGQVALKLAGSGLAEEALAMVGQLRRSFPESPEIPAYRAVVLNRLGRNEDAVVAIDEALRMGEALDNFPDRMARFRLLKSRFLFTPYFRCRLTRTLNTFPVRFGSFVIAGLFRPDVRSERG